MENKDIGKILGLGAQLMELHDMNQFKVRSVSSAVRKLEGFDFRVSDKSYDELVSIDGIGKGLASNLVQIYNTGTFDELETLLQNTPKGVVSMLNIKGIGVKKVRALWKDLNIENKGDLLSACHDGRVAEAKGFGKKTAENIIEQLKYEEEQIGKFLYAEVENFAYELEKLLSPHFENTSITGQFRLCREYIDKLQFIVSTNDFTAAHTTLSSLDYWIPQESESSPFIWRGRAKEVDLQIEVILSSPENYFGELLKSSSSSEHFLADIDGSSLSKITLTNKISSEEQAYQKLNKTCVIPELRETATIFDKEINYEKLLAVTDLKGILHNHSTYSDGKNTLREMADYCKELGYQYLGISDHSKSAFYANGLDEDRIAEQHREIDVLNKEYGSSFRIFKGIESDILNDGSLDYDDDILATFDFIVSSIHSNLNMDKNKATQRLIKAVENKYTTILGHPTGRLLLRREGYPIDHAKVIDACAAHEVIIEINANPWRLDLDWRWVEYALDKGVKLAINPDAHEKKGYLDMKYGVLTGRKGGLTVDMTFNALDINQVSSWFENRKKQ